MATTARVLFAPLEDGESRARFFGLGFIIQCAALTFIVIVPLLMPQKLEAVRRYWITPIEAPVIEAWKPQPPKPVAKPTPRPVVAKVIPPPEPVAPPKPKIYSPVFTSPIAKPATAKRNTPNPDAPVMTNVFADKTHSSLGSSAIPTLKRPREEVQTGGFGDPNGVPPNPYGHGSPNIAQVGQFDLPPGPGYGNGTGGSKGARGIVASSGFGNGVAAPVSGGAKGSVQQGLFADQSTATAAPKVKPAAATNRVEPVEILFKPRPQYTAEARGAKIEGEVLLQVVFTASGQVQVQHIVQGLGYGLNDTAEAAARQIKFKPARQDGQPVDSNAVVHIVFELAY